MSREDSARYEESWRVEDVEVCCYVAVQWRNGESINFKYKKWLFLGENSFSKHYYCNNVFLLAIFENSRLKKVVCYRKEEEFHLREMDIFN